MTDIEKKNYRADPNLYGAIIVARLSSSRLPQKNILPIVGKPMIEHLIDRVKRSKRPLKIIIATSNEVSDDPLQELAGKYGIHCHRGSLNNVMERIVGAANEFNVKNIIEILGDNPLVHGDLIDNVIDLFERDQCDYAATATKEYDQLEESVKKFSVGVRVQLYPVKIGQKYIDFPKYIHNEEKHPCAFIFDNPKQFSLRFLEAKGDWEFLNKPDLNFAVNYPKNFQFVIAIFEALYPQNLHFTLSDMFKFLAENQQLQELLGPE